MEDFAREKESIESMRMNLYKLGCKSSFKVWTIGITILNITNVTIKENLVKMSINNKNNSP